MGIFTGVNEQIIQKDCQCVTFWKLNAITNNLSFFMFS